MSDIDIASLRRDALYGKNRAAAIDRLISALSDETDEDYTGPPREGERYATEIEWEGHMNSPWTIPGARWENVTPEIGDPYGNLVIPHVSRMARFEGDETVLALVDGTTVRSGGDDQRPDCVSGGYVAVYGPDGEEIMSWTSNEWAEDPILVMGAMLNCAAGARLSR